MCFRALIVFALLLKISLTEIINNVTVSPADYGSKWMFFPDGDGTPRFVDLMSDVDDDTMLRISDVVVEFRLYTRRNPVQYEDVTDLVERPRRGYRSNFFSPRADVKVVTHGWESSADSEAVQSIKDAFLREQDVNVIAVDWSKQASSVVYVTSAASTADVGQRVGRFINKLETNFHVHENQIHLIGHSLGSHVMGNAGSSSGLNVSRITGLDPARPLFEFPWLQDKDKRLDTSDAQFVDVIHTCAGILGFEDPLGHADFYPNNGNFQPGCPIEKFYEACSHGRAFQYFAESIVSQNGFLAYPCNNWIAYLEGKCKHNPVMMGNPAPPNARGTFYLLTNTNQPFARGQPKFT